MNKTFDRITETMWKVIWGKETSHKEQYSTFHFVLRHGNASTCSYNECLKLVPTFHWCPLDMVNYIGTLVLGLNPSDDYGYEPQVNQFPHRVNTEPKQIVWFSFHLIWFSTLIVEIINFWTKVLLYWLLLVPGANPP